MIRATKELDMPIENLSTEHYVNIFEELPELMKENNPKKHRVIKEFIRKY